MKKLWNWFTRDWSWNVKPVRNYSFEINKPNREAQPIKMFYLVIGADFLSSNEIYKFHVQMQWRTIDEVELLNVEYDRRSIAGEVLAVGV